MLISKILINLVPPFFFNFYEYLKNFLILNFNFFLNEDIFRNKDLKNIKNKNRAFLIATGSSLSEENLNLLKGEDCFTLSNAFLLDQIDNINPLMHFFSPYHAPITKKSFKKWLIESDKRLPKKTSIVMSYSDRNFKDKNLFKYRNVFYLYITKKISKFHTDIQKPLPKFQTGSLMILPVLINLGYEKIYLLGCDHNQLKDFNSRIENFYKEKQDVRCTKKTKLNQSWLKLDKELSASLLAYQQYREYNKIAKDRGIEIINLSENSWLDIFKKKKLENII